MKKTDYGFTLVELVVTVALMGIILTGGTAMFFGSFKSSGVSDIQTSINNSLRSLDEVIERTLLYGTVVRVVSAGVDHDRDSCISAGENGVAGSSLVVRDASGGTAVYALADGVVTSNSGEVISNSAVVISRMEFTWFCRPGVNDMINLDLEATMDTVSGDGITSEFSKTINLINSGIN